MSITAYECKVTSTHTGYNDGYINARLFTKAMVAKIVEKSNVVVSQNSEDSANNSIYTSLDLGTGESLALYKPRADTRGYIGAIKEGDEINTMPRSYVTHVYAAQLNPIYEYTFILFVENDILLAIAFTGYMSYNLVFYYDGNKVNIAFYSTNVSTSNGGFGSQSLITAADYLYAGKCTENSLRPTTFFTDDKVCVESCLWMDKDEKLIGRRKYPALIGNRRISTFPYASGATFRKFKVGIDSDAKKYIHIGNSLFMPYDTLVTEDIIVT